MKWTILIGILIFLSTLVFAVTGDVNSDGVVDILDLVVAVNCMNGQCNGQEDLNSDGFVDILDLVIIVNNLGSTGPSCTPSQEVCDGVDNDCDGTVDEGCGTTQPPTCNPTTEICDNKDNDCDGLVDESLTCGSQTCTDNDNDYFCANQDCNDNDPNVNWAQKELCFDGIDNNCQSGIDENCPTSPSCTDKDNDGYNDFSKKSCPTGTDCDSGNPNTNPGAQEICGDRIDNNCNLVVDENCGFSGPTCGNNACESGESCSTCSADCGTCSTVAPVIVEDWTLFDNWNDFVANHNAAYKNWGTIVHGHSTVNMVTIDGERAFMRQFRHDAAKTANNPCVDQQINDVDISPGPFDNRINPDFWIETEFMFSSQWTTSTPHCNSGKWDYKFLLVKMLDPNVAGKTTRPEIKLGSNGDNVAASAQGFSSQDAVRVRPGNPWPAGDTNNRRYPPETVFSNIVQEADYVDGNWHRARFSVVDMGRKGPTGGALYHVYADIDGVMTHNYITETTPDPYRITRFQFGSNRNSWPDETMYRYDRNVKIYDTDPGWGGSHTPTPTEYYNSAPWSTVMN